MAPNRSRSPSRSRSRSRSNNRDKNPPSNPTQQPQNVFSVLNNDVNEHELVNRDNPKNSHVNNYSSSVKRVPPIVVEGLKMNRVQEILLKIPYLSNLPHVKNTINGHHAIYAKTLSDHNKLEKYLRDNNISGYTHEIEHRLKYVIYGLHSVDTDDLKEELKNRVNVLPVHVYSIPIKEKKYDDQNVYVVHFLKSSGVSLNKLRLVKDIFNVIVQWDMYQPNKRSDPSEIKPPTQCSNCQSYNHGSRGCFKPPKCIRCGENHKSADCRYLLQTNSLGEIMIKDKIDSDKVRCANCNERHTANFRGCRIRQEIINDRTKRRQTLGKRHEILQHPQGRYQAPPPPVQDNSHYPLPPPLSRPIGNNSWQNTTATPHNNVNNSCNDNSLFSYDKLREIFSELIRRISACTTKAEQLSVVCDITLTYLNE